MNVNFIPYKSTFWDKWTESTEMSHIEQYDEKNFLQGLLLLCVKIKGLLI